MQSTNPQDLDSPPFAIADLILGLAQALADNKDSVRVQTTQHHQDITLCLYLAPEDTQKIVGKNGRTARSLRTIVAAASLKHSHRYSLVIAGEEQAPAEA